MVTTTSPTDESSAVRSPTDDRAAAVLRALSFNNISAIYIFVVVFLVFSIWIPERFLQPGVWRSLLDAEALTGLALVAAARDMREDALVFAQGAAELDPGHEAASLLVRNLSLAA
jgi:hypothetical protein